ncbi:hypothetical protein D3C84_934710 [compost metagenome]
MLIDENKLRDASFLADLHSRLNELLENPSAPRCWMHHTTNFHLSGKETVNRQETDNSIIFVIDKIIRH